ncbi:protein phosphatase methylesterase 1 [Trichinella spiralis]|uniref:protein phosphatase methylesterase 1 n=1 Tax=Trichinella spiralis TaxID=6334 RepID=UPI0001EFCA60|nr:protein phosphatase methylesterase 1 [Trichinella spiralis]
MTLLSNGSVSARPRPSAFNRRFSTDERKEFSRFKKEVHNCLRLMGEDVEEFRSELESNEPPKMELLRKVSVMFARRWKLKDELSEVAFRGLLLILEHCLAYQVTNHDAFAHFVEVLGYHTVFFWKKSVPLLYDSDMQFGTAYRDALLLRKLLAAGLLGDANDAHFERLVVKNVNEQQQQQQQQQQQYECEPETC